ncbi:hypothetical protein DPEC_G00002270 [Dallia pectoralis]|uniref:Uncharacterized protein n=1 Tax=Dallia pectoralis TaxID=75939 RepID=A0ACC2HIZ6_DALPE|nr:hypothetical protein DPEC_G00002270 [Dallia pectoralis]
MDYLQQLQVYYWTWPHPHRTLWHGHRGTKFYSPKAQLPGPGITYPPQTHRLALSMFPANLKHFLSRVRWPMTLEINPVINHKLPSPDLQWHLPHFYLHR